MPKIYVAKRVIDYVGLSARGIPEGTLAIDETMAPVLALLQGMGSDGAKLISVDANGNLAVTLAGQANTGNINLQLVNGNLAVTEDVSLDGRGSGVIMAVTTKPEISNGATWDKQRSAGSVNLGATSSLGAAMSAPPGQWSASSNPAVGTAASASRAAVGPGVRNVASGAIIVISATTALAVITTVTFNFRDGAAGAGTILFSIQVTLPAAVIPVTAIPIPPLNIPGSTNTAMTLEGSANVANLMESISLFGYNAP